MHVKTTDHVSPQSTVLVATGRNVKVFNPCGEIAKGRWAIAQPVVDGWQFVVVR